MSGARYAKVGIEPTYGTPPKSRFSWRRVNPRLRLRCRGSGRVSIIGRISFAHGSRKLLGPNQWIGGWCGSRLGWDTPFSAPARLHGVRTTVTASTWFEGSSDL